MHAFRVHCNVVIARASFFLFDESRSLKIHSLLHIPPNGIINPLFCPSTHDALTIEAARPLLVSSTSPRHIGKPRTYCAVAFLLSRRAILPRPCMTPLILDRYNLVSTWNNIALGNVNTTTSNRFLQHISSSSKGDAHTASLSDVGLCWCTEEDEVVRRGVRGVRSPDHRVMTVGPHLPRSPFLVYTCIYALEPVLDQYHYLDMEYSRSPAKLVRHIAASVCPRLGSLRPNAIRLADEAMGSSPSTRVSTADLSALTFGHVCVSLHSSDHQ